MFAPRRPQHHRSTPRGTPEILAVIGVEHGRMRILAYKSSNISETQQGRTKITFITIEDQYEVLYTRFRLCQHQQPWMTGGLLYTTFA